MNILLACMAAVFLGAAVSEPIPVRIADAWRIEVGPGIFGGRELSQAVQVDVAPPPRMVVRDERHAAIPVFNPRAGGWMRGAIPTGIRTEECTATERLFPETFRVKSAAGDAGVLYVAGKDYQLDPFWGTFGRLAGGGIGEEQEVFLDYEYEQDRLDALAVSPTGEVRLFPGVAGLGSVSPAAVPGEDAPAAYVWVTGGSRQLTEDNLYPVFPDDAGDKKGVDQAETLLPRVLEKLRTGMPVTLVTFGDSVTCGGGVGSDQSQWWQGQFLAQLKSRFPKSEIVWKNAGWGGASSAAYINAPRGSEHDYVRDVLEPKPDLVIIEFVNDAYLDEAGVEEHYGRILADLRGVGAEVILMTPHLVRPDWMGLTTSKVKEDPRPYVRGLKAFGAKHGVAIADASALYCGLWRRGIPYMTLMTNSINHPDARGHQLFADALMALFQ